MKPIIHFTKKEIENKKREIELKRLEELNNPKRRKWGTDETVQEKEKEVDLSIVFDKKRMRIGGGLPLYGRSTSDIATTTMEEMYMYVTVTQKETYFEIEAIKSNDETIDKNRKVTPSSSSSSHAYKGRITFYEIIQLMKVCPMLNFNRMSRDVMITRMLSLCTLTINTASVDNGDKNNLKRGGGGRTNKRRERKNRQLICSHGRDINNCRECRHFSIGLGKYNSLLNSSIVTIPICHHAYSLGKRNKMQAMRSRTIEIPIKELTLDNVVAAAPATTSSSTASTTSNQRLSLDVESFDDINDLNENSRLLTKLIINLKSGMSQSNQWLGRETKKVIREEKSLNKELVKLNNILTKRKNEKESIEQKICNEEKKQKQKKEEEVNEIEEGNEETQEDTKVVEITVSAELKKLQKELKKATMLHQAAQASVDSKTMLKAILNEYAETATKVLETATKIKDQTFDTFHCSDELRNKFESLISHQKDVVLVKLKNDYIQCSKY
jgi:hypothetical protein